jgi:hypothetical protein
LSCNLTGKIRTSQDKLTIELDTCLDLTSGVSSVEIEYKKPDNSTGSWVASIVDKTKISYTLADEEFLDQEGSWSFKARVNFSDNTTASGLVYTEVVYGEWD